MPNVEEYPGHIACDGETKSELVIPMEATLEGREKTEVLGVMDLDCVALGGFEEADREGLEKIVKLLVAGSDW